MCREEKGSPELNCEGRLHSNHKFQGTQKEICFCHCRVFLLDLFPKKVRLQHKSHEFKLSPLCLLAK